MVNENEESMAFTIRLDGEVMEIFKRIQQETGIKRKAEVIRYIIKMLEKHESNPSE